ncbi:MAG: TonB C-terminal domain-containing protein [Acidobacteriota bacterium]|nr:TonB C-terminal domain-containing protein [Acidobacteriota bacterium]
MSILEPQSNWNEPEKPGAATAVAEGAESEETRSASESETPSGRGRSTSRWVDYDTHELLEMISELEDERRWSRLREGIWLAILIHILLLSAITWIPRYVFKVPPVIDPFDAIKSRKDLSYLDLPPDALKQLRPKVQIKPVKPPQLDKKMLEEMQKQEKPVLTPTPPAPQEQQPPQTQNPVKPRAQQQAPISPSETSKSAIQAPKPEAAPSRPNFAVNSGNPAEQLQQAMRNAARGPSYQANSLPAGGGLSMHPGAGSGGVEILSNTQGVDFSAWLQKWYIETERTWDPLIPDEVNPPILKSGAVQIRFKVAPNGRVMEMHLEGRSGDTALDRAAWGAIVGSNYPPLPGGFHGPYLELRAVFLYNMRPPGQ